MNEAVAFAPGKVVLLGEHSVVFGEPAVAAALDRGLEVRIRRGEGGARQLNERSRSAIARAAGFFAVDASTLTVEVRSDLPEACGLGSSAALSLGLIRAVARLTERPLGAEEESRLAGEVENVFHGTASGLDVAASATGGIVFFQRGNPPRVEPVRAARSFEVVVGLSGEARSTAGPVGRLRQRREQRPALYDRLFGLAGDLARQGRAAIERGDLPELGALMDVAQGVLNACGVSTPTLERMIGIARAGGALGAKLTGAGGGGAMLALAGAGGGSPVRAALADAGFEAFVAAVGMVNQGTGDAKKATEEDDAVQRRNRA